MHKERVLVFGSNRQGRHGKGTAAAARASWGAKYGIAEGRQGNSYAIITKELRDWYLPVSLDEIRDGVVTFLQYAKENPETLFILTPIGCGLAGFTPEQIAPMFKNASENVSMPTSFVQVLDEQPRHVHLLRTVVNKEVVSEYVFYTQKREAHNLEYLGVAADPVKFPIKYPLWINKEGGGIIMVTKPEGEAPRHIIATEEPT